jgi:hypothetical protein
MQADLISAADDWAAKMEAMGLRSILAKDY